MGKGGGEDFHSDRRYLRQRLLLAMYQPTGSER